MRNFVIRLITGLFLLLFYLFSVFWHRALYVVFFAFCSAWAAIFEWPFLTRTWPWWARLGIGVFYFCTPLLVIEHLYVQYSQGSLLPIVYPVLVATVCDSAAYFVGKFFGRHYVFPRISPKKTYEGLVAAYLSVVFAHFILWAYSVQPTGYFRFILDYPVITAVFVATAAVLGDVSISVLKRRSGVKDSGRIFPGHGGVLDRGGSLICVIFFVGFLMLFC